MLGDEMYIDVQEEEMANLITMLEGYQDGTFRTYKALLNYYEKEA